MSPVARRHIHTFISFAFIPVVSLFKYDALKCCVGLLRLMLHTGYCTPQDEGTDTAKNRKYTFFC
jgi:hypothetical protein